MNVPLVPKHHHIFGNIVHTPRKKHTCMEKNANPKKLIGWKKIPKLKLSTMVT
jgi:hypothetical protein